MFLSLLYFKDFMKKTKIDNFAGFKYISLINVPIKSTRHGEMIDMDPQKLDLIVAKAIIEKQIPIHGKELKFLRKVLGMSLEKFANEIDLVSTSVFRWEKNEDERLAKVNEVAVRAFIAEKLGLSCKPFSFLKGSERTPEYVELRVG